MRGVPKRYKDRTFDNFDPTVSKAAQTAFEAAKHALETRTSLVLIGRPGTGKTHLAAAIGNSLTGIDDFFSEWANVAELADALRQDVRGTDNDGRAWLNDITRKSGRLLVLDDLGREKVSDFTGEAIYRVINGRYEAMVPTVVTSNLTMPELEANGYGPVISRLSEEGRIVQMDSATDYRTRMKVAA
jgi:DNA replication protein DnaC